MKPRPVRLSLRIIATALLPAFAVVYLIPPEAAYAWKPHTHALTANTALVDAMDGYICLPGLSEEPISLGETELIGWYTDNGAWKPYNDLKDLGPYLRAGTMGPDAFPDAVWGQLATHVDHTRLKAPEPTDPLSLGFGNVILDPVVVNKIIRTLKESTPRWRSIDWGHEVLKQALDYHKDQLHGKKRADILGNRRLEDLLSERQGAIMFALGYLMHMAGDSFAHSWINEWTGQPFDFKHGRQTEFDDIAPELSPILEELQHNAIEKYVDTRYAPELAGTGCAPVDATFLTESTSICDREEPVKFEPDCDYCNPLRSYIDQPLPEDCDHCFKGCNPWRRVCPQRLPDAGCMDCPGRDAAIQRCQELDDGTECNPAVSECIENVEIECAKKALSPPARGSGAEGRVNNCCAQSVKQLVAWGVMSKEDAEFTCLNDEPPKDNTFGTPIKTPLPVSGTGLDLWKTIKDNETALEMLEEQGGIEVSDTERAQIERLAPCGCSQAPLAAGVLEKDKAVTLPDGTTKIIPKGTKIGENEIDFNGDGEPDLLNECMLWNCLLSPGSEYCPLAALAQTLPSYELTSGLVCENVDTLTAVNNPDLLLRKNDIAISSAFYKKVFMERRFPAGEKVGAVGTWSLGGPVINGTYALTDFLKYAEGQLRALDNPIGFLTKECHINKNEAACELGAKLVEVGLWVHMVTIALLVLGTAAYGIPFVGPIISAILTKLAIYGYTVAAILLSGIYNRATKFYSLFSGAVTLPMALMRSRLAKHLDQDWLQHVVATADKMSGQSCRNTCGDPSIEDRECTEHRFFGLNGYLDWALETYDIVGNFDCNEANYIVQAIEGNPPSLDDSLKIVKSSGLVLITQWAGCHVFDFIYKKLRKPLEEQIAKTIFDTTSDWVCSIVGFYEESALGNSYEVCQEKIKILFGMADGPTDARGYLQALSAFIKLLDEGGLDREQKDKIYGKLNAILEKQGYQVNFQLLESVGNQIDCSADLQVDLTSLIQQLNPHEAIVAALKTRADGNEEAEQAVDKLDRALGFYQEQKEMVDNGQEQLAPADISRFYPLYNTIQLNKLIFLGSGQGSCDRVRAECAPKAGEPLAQDCEQMLRECDPLEPDNPLTPYPTTLPGKWSNGGLWDLVRKANEKELSAAYTTEVAGPTAAYSVEPIDARDSTFLRSFFQEHFIEDKPGEHSCAQIGWNVMCNALYSLDDPDDYCRDLERWSPEYAQELATNTTNDSTGTDVPDTEDGMFLFNDRPYVAECGPALSNIDERNLPRYEPSTRSRLGPVEDPHVAEYWTPLSPDEHQAIYNHRAVMTDRVVKQALSFEEGTAQPFWRQRIEDQLTWVSDRVRKNLTNVLASPPSPSSSSDSSFTPFRPDLPRFSFPEWVREAILSGLTDGTASEEYYPHDLTRFSLTNKDNHVSRLYARIMSPYYCPDDPLNQLDTDCDTIPDSCDNCPETYNPDQMDANRDAIGDDCEGYDPFVNMVPTPPDKVKIKCVSVTRRMMSSLISMAAKAIRLVSKEICGAGNSPMPPGLVRKGFVFRGPPVTVRPSLFKKMLPKLLPRPSWCKAPLPSEGSLVDNADLNPTLLTAK